MGYAEEYLKDTELTEESVLRDLEILASYYDDMDLEGRVLPAKEDLPMPTLLAALEPDDRERPRIVSHSFVPLDTEAAEFTKYLQFYCELPCPVEGLDRATLLEAVCRLNGHLPLGSCVLADPNPVFEQPMKAAVRSIQGFPLEGPVDQGVFTEDLFLFDLSCDLVTTVLDGLNDGLSLDEAFARIGR